MRDVVGVHHGEGVVDVALGTGLVAEDAERDDNDVQGPETGEDVVEHRALPAHVVGVELHAVYRRRAGIAEMALRPVEVVGATGGEHHPGSAGEPARHRQPDLAPSAEHQDRSVHAAQSAACHLPAAGGPAGSVTGFRRRECARRRRSRRRCTAADPTSPSGR